MALPAVTLPSQVTVHRVVEATLDDGHGKPVRSATHAAAIEQALRAATLEAESGKAGKEKVVKLKLANSGTIVSFEKSTGRILVPAATCVSSYFQYARALLAADAATNATPRAERYMAIDWRPPTRTPAGSTAALWWPCSW